jgi:hypothetical protein
MYHHNYAVVYTPPPIPEIPVRFRNSRWIPSGFQSDSGILGGVWVDSSQIPEFRLESGWIMVESSFWTSVAMFLYLFA